MRLTAVAAPGVLTGSVTGRETFAAALAARGAEGDLLLSADEEDFAAHLRSAAAGGEFLLITGDDTPADDLLGGLLPRLGATAVRLDLDPRAPDRSTCLRRHVRHRGTGGLRSAVDDWYFHATAPGTRRPYGPDPDQHGELRLPPGPGPFPVAVLVHGGYWRSRWDADTTTAAAVDLTRRGFATWNVEYRRPDRHGWDATTADVDAALSALADLDADLDAGLDLDRVVLLGHSAGGQLVTRLAADRAGGEPAGAASGPARVRPALTVSLAGCLDLHSIHARALSEGAVAAALGGTPQERPEVYAASSPLARVPVGSPLVVVCCRSDDPDLLDASRRFAAAAVAAGDDVTVVEEEGDHFSVIDPGSRVWAAVTAAVRARVQR
ncbi:acetyl esterase/lipase [Kineococcus radiotolerans]|uniref:Acetyl esterase/lipase n=1 Tax=Kineococcus radiotolerans TaxID=131568 RepID=A0A7W4TJB9_KINRA|nr:alpha/beta hydrolase [Kineococcus radiotolerans]MBB2899532.1 acetyl esterase/lipase [Kineococcus radiotolerans]